MNLREVEENLAEIDGEEGTEFLYALLRAYGLPKASISRLRSGTYDRADGADEHLWKGKVYFRTVAAEDDALYEMIEMARAEERIASESPRFLIIENGRRVLARDCEKDTTLDVGRSELVDHATFFLPWAGIEKTQIENVSMADVKAAEKMARLYDEVTRHNEIDTDEQRHELNVFFSRLLFCFFAEDTGVFLKGTFSNAVGSFTEESGADTAAFFDELFQVLDTAPGDRGGVSAYLVGFGYVNGKLFQRRAAAPAFTPRARSIVLECGSLDWSQINPDIFGSMMQAVVRPSHREGLGMHYTSVENILKAIRPLFLEGLEQQLASADTVRKLERLLDRLAEVRVFDPACGSGNFLVIAYKELRRIEHAALRRIAELEPHRAALFQFSRIDLENFYGIEIDDFAHEVAILSLWLAKHQMNREFHDLFGVEIPLIPLVEAGQVHCGNAARIDWGQVAPEGPVFLVGNPPYQGGTLQSEYQKQDLVLAFDDRTVNKYLDYVSIWVYKAAAFIAEREGSEAALVTTNSITQGNQVGLLWPRVFDLDIEISFAHTSFKWSNAARGNAGVTCVVLGLAREGQRRGKALYSTGSRMEASQINPYLVADGGAEIVIQAQAPISALPPMVFGSMPRDGGHLLLDPEEAASIVRSFPDAEKFIRRYGGASEVIRGTWRRCLWIPDHQADEAAAIPPIADRLAQVAAFRGRSKAESTRAFAASPHRFVQRAHRDTTAIVVPRVSSERRRYVPLGFVDGSTVVSDSACAIYDAQPWLFGLIHSRMHMAWLEAIGGRMKTDYRYSANLVYNTFPTPPLSEGVKAKLAEGAVRVLAVRESFPDRTLAELYDPDQMPEALSEAHSALDGLVDGLYRQAAFRGGEERLRVLFQMYTDAIREAS